MAGGGGGEHKNAILLQKLQQSLGATDGQKLYGDLREAEEAEAFLTRVLQAARNAAQINAHREAAQLAERGLAPSPPAKQQVHQAVACTG